MGSVTIVIIVYFQIVHGVKMMNGRSSETFSRLLTDHTILNEGTEDELVSYFIPPPPPPPTKQIFFFFFLNLEGGRMFLLSATSPKQMD